MTYGIGVKKTVTDSADKALGEPELLPIDAMYFYQAKKILGDDWTAEEFASVPARIIPMATIKGNKMKNEAIGQDELCAMVNKITGENHTTDTHGFMAFDSSVNLVAPNNFLKNECNHIIGIDNGMGDMWEGIIYEDSEKVKKHDLRELALERLDVPDDFKDKLRLAMKNNG